MPLITMLTLIMQVIAITLVTATMGGILTLDVVTAATPQHILPDFAIIIKAIIKIFKKG